MASARDYITHTLGNPAAALRLIEDTEKAIRDRLSHPLAFEPFPSAKDRAQPYYRIRVKNYTVFYVVIGDVMELRRFVYSRRDLASLI